MSNSGFVLLLVLSLCEVVVVAVQITNARNGIANAEEHHSQDLQEDWFHNQFAIGKSPISNLPFYVHSAC